MMNGFGRPPMGGNGGWGQNRPQMPQMGQPQAPNWGQSQSHMPSPNGNAYGYFQHNPHYLAQQGQPPQAPQTGGPGAPFDPAQGQPPQLGGGLPPFNPGQGMPPQMQQGFPGQANGGVFPGQGGGMPFRGGPLGGWRG